MRGFTLIELLVVVAIIALLVGILMPSLAKAKELARVTACASRLRGVGLATQIYAADYDEYPCPQGQEGFDSENPMWQAWPGPGTSYNAGTAVFYIGMLTKDPTWFYDEQYQCTARHPTGEPTSDFFMRGWQGRMVGQSNCSSTFDGTRYDAPEQKPWFIYVSPFAVSSYFVSPTDWGQTTNALGTLCFGPNAGEDCMLNPADQHSGEAWRNYRGPQVRQRSARRAQFSCPGPYDNLDPWTSYFTPHGKQTYIGNRMSMPGPDDRNYLFVDGSVERVVR